MDERASFLFSRPSMLSGMGRTLDLMGLLNHYNKSGTPAEADALALHNDWSAVGEELASALASLREELESEQLQLFSEPE